MTADGSVFPVPGYAFYGVESGNFFIVGAGGGGGGNPTGFFTITAGGISLIAPNSCSASNGGGNPCFIDSATVLPARFPTPYTVTVSYPAYSNFHAGVHHRSTACLPHHNLDPVDRFTLICHLRQREDRERLGFRDLGEQLAHRPDPVDGAKRWDHGVHDK